MTRFGKLYDKLIVMPGQPTFPAYYKLVQRVIEEMKNEFPGESSHDYGDALYDEWFRKWFGVEENSEDSK